MSPEDYNTFYWSGLKRTIEKLIAADIIPYVSAKASIPPVWTF